MHYSRWGALGLLADALAGPTAFVDRIRLATRDDPLVLDSTFGEGIALVHTDAKELLIFGGKAIRYIRPVRQAYVRLLANTWSGWRVRWCATGIAEAWKRVGYDSREFSTPAERPSEDRLFAAGAGSFTWVTVVAETPSDYPFDPEPGELLLVGPKILEYCAAREPGVLPAEDQLGGGLLIDPINRTVAWWSCGLLLPSRAELDASWAGWDIRPLLDGLLGQVAGSGRDPSRYALTPEATQRHLAEDLFPLAKSDPVPSIRRLEEYLRGQGGSDIHREAPDPNLDRSGDEH